MCQEFSFLFGFFRQINQLSNLLYMEFKNSASRFPNLFIQIVSYLLSFVCDGSSKHALRVDSRQCDALSPPHFLICFFNSVNKVYVSWLTGSDTVCDLCETDLDFFSLAASPMLANKQQQQGPNEHQAHIFSLYWLLIHKGLNRQSICIYLRLNHIQLSWNFNI